jgi:signal transduction histidine kinase/HAMP domain-containing protein
MIRDFFSSLRGRLILLIALAVAPAFGLLLYTARDQRLAVAENAKQEALNLARDISRQQYALVSEARQYLSQLVQRPEIDITKPKDCSAFLASELAKRKRYTGLGAAGLDGYAWCTARMANLLVYIGDRAHFKSTVNTRDFSIGNYQIGRITGKANIGFGFPLFDAKGKLQGIVFATLDLSWLNEFFNRTHTASGLVVCVIDHQGMILARSIEPGKWIGKTIPHYPLIKAAMSQRRETAVEGRGLDGVDRLYAVAPLMNSGHAPAYISVGIPAKAAYAKVTRAFVTQLVLLGLITAIVLLIAWVGSDLCILRQVQALIATTERIARGELTARTGAALSKGEFGQLAASFDAMAQSLERRCQQTTALHEIELAIASTLELLPMLNLLLERIDIALPNSITTIRLINKETGELERVACRNIDREAWRAENKRDLHGLAKIVLENKTAITIANVQTDPRSKDHHFVHRYGLVSYLGIPLIAKAEVLGIISFYTKEQHCFNDEEIEFLTTLAGQSAIAIHNARLYSETKQRADEISALHALTAAATQSLDLNVVLNEAIKKITEIFHFDATRIFLFNAEMDALEVKAGFAVKPEFWAQVRVFQPGRGIVGIVADSGESLIFEDIRRDPRYRELSRTKSVEKAGALFLAVFPIKTKAKNWGTLVCIGEKPRRLAANETNLLMSMASQTGIAVENASLFSAVKQRTIDLEKANKGKDEFLGIVSHELKTPLNVIRGYTELMRDGSFGEITAQQEKALAKISDESTDLFKMIESILQVTTIEAEAVTIRDRVVDLRDFVADLRSDYDGLASEGLTIRWDYSSDLSLMRTDDEKLKAVVQNLVNNAIKFTKEGEIVVSIRYLLNASKVEFKVADTGIGIPRERLPSIFDMFEQVDSSTTRNHGGVGLGLYISRKFTELLGGKIQVESESGKGSVFTVTLPVACDGAAGECHDYRAAAGCPTEL